MNWRGLLITAAAVGLLAPAVPAAVSIGGAQSLYIQPGARPAGMGDCFVATADDASACWWNPAGLAFLGKTHGLSLMHTQLVPDWEDVYYEYSAYAQRVEGLGTIAVSLIYLTYGEQEGRDSEGLPTGTFTSYEVVPSIAYGTTIGENLAIGLGLKFIYVDLAPARVTVEHMQGTGSTFGADLGALYRMYDGRLRFGGTVQHVGPRIAYIDEEQSDPLPRNLKVGAAYDVASDEMNRLTACCEYNKSLVIVEEIAHPTVGVILNAGAEYTYYDLLAVRAGYVHDEDGKVKGLAWGIGLRYKDIAFDVANVPQAAGLTRPSRFSLTASF